MPDPVKNRLANRHEYVIHLTYKPNYYYDLVGYSEEFGNGANPGDVWTINLERNLGQHLAPYPRELVRRAITLAAPKQVCAECAVPRRRVIERTAELDPTRPQAKRAMELADAHGLTPEHIRAIQAFGVSGRRQGHEVPERQRVAIAPRCSDSQLRPRLHSVATFANSPSQRSAPLAGLTAATEPQPVAWCSTHSQGTGTTLKTAIDEGRDAVGVDLVNWMEKPDIGG